MNTKQLAKQMRLDVVRMAYEGKTSHVASALSCVDILAVLYHQIMTIDPKDWQNKNADRFILSKGHGAKALYAVLAAKGFFDKKLLDTYGQDGSELGEHPHAGKLAGISATTGSLGHGLAIASGIAMAKKQMNNQGRVYVLISDGECNEGSIWEAAMGTVGLKINNLTVIIDDNGWQAMGRSREVSSLDPLDKKWEAFGWRVFRADGHNHESLAKVLNEAKANTDKPSVVIAKTVLGYGVDFMQDDLLWHYQIPSHEQFLKAKQEIEAS